MAAKKSVGTKSQKSKVVRVNLSIGEEESQLLFIRALTSRGGAGEIITSLIASKVRECGLPTNLLVRSGVHDRLSVIDHVSDSAPPPALQYAA